MLCWSVQDVTDSYYTHRPGSSSAVLERTSCCELWNSYFSVHAYCVVVGLSVWSEVQTCICHCHSLSLASVKSRLVFTFLVPAHPPSLHIPPPQKKCIAIIPLMKEYFPAFICCAVWLWQVGEWEHHYSVIYRLDVLPATQPTVSKHLALTVHKYSRAIHSPVLRSKG